MTESCTTRFSCWFLQLLSDKKRNSLWGGGGHDSQDNKKPPDGLANGSEANGNAEGNDQPGRFSFAMSMGKVTNLSPDLKLRVLPATLCCTPKPSTHRCAKARVHHVRPWIPRSAAQPD